MFKCVPQNKYQEYIRSDDWRRKATKAKKRAGNKCQKCGSISNLEVHHLTYERLGNENFSDLMVLCDMCHRAEHGLTIWD